MNEVVTDANLIVKFVLYEPLRNQARRFIQDCNALDTQMIAPPVFESEIDTIIRRRVHEGRMTLTEGENAYSALALVPVQIVTHPDLRQRAREIAAQADQPAVYDSRMLRLPNYAAASSGQRIEPFTTRFTPICRLFTISRSIRN